MDFESLCRKNDLPGGGGVVVVVGLVVVVAGLVVVVVGLVVVVAGLVAVVVVEGARL